MKPMTALENSFEEALYAAKAKLLSLLPQTEAYLVSNIYTQFTLYIVDASTEVIDAMKHELSGLVTKVAAIKSGDFIYQDLQVSKTAIGTEDSKLYFVNRHADKTNWYLAPHAPLPRQAYVVAFYSFKGGLGRTTALVLSALHLTRQGKRVVLVDFDLEAPGLGPLFQPDFPDIATVRGTADLPIDLADYYYTINQQDLTGSQGGELIIFPATYSESSERKMNYIDKLSKINIQYNELNPGSYAPDNLLKLIDERLEPDFIFIDTRTGINDIGGLVLQRYAHSAFLFFQGNTQNMFGLEALLPKIISFDLPFYLVNSPTPREPETRKSEIAYFLNTSYKTFVNNYYSSDDIPDIEDDTADHYPINIPYNDLATFLDSAQKLRSLLDEGGAENPYLQLANYVLIDNLSTSSLPTQETTSNPVSLVKAMSEITSGAAASESELNSEEDLRINFYPRIDYRFIFERNKFLILGEKGSGKTALYAVLSQAKYARELAKFCGVNNHEWRRTIWIKGLGKEGERYPSRANFTALHGMNENQLRNYWLILLCREIDSIVFEFEPKIQLEPAVAEASFLELRLLAQDYSLSEKLEDYLAQVNKHLASASKYITIIYDYLDSLLTEEGNLRGDLVAALLGLWYEYQNRFSNLRTKIFLRKDIYEREIRTGLTDKVKLNNFRQEIEWNLPQLLNMIWKRILERDPDNGRNFVIPVLDGSSLQEEPILGIIPNFSQEQHTKLLELLFGSRMGGSNKAIPYKWIEQHIADTFRHIQPRSILNLFALGAESELKDPSVATTIIRPQNFESVVRGVSEARVRDLWEEYPVLQPIFDDLREHLPQFPVQDIDLQKALIDIKAKHDSLTKHDVKDLLQELINVGVLYEYKFNRTATGGTRYHIPDLYLFGLGLTRKGPGAYKNIFDIQRRIVRRR
jgi:hypothetical protein